jgi:hypothetical protein
LRAGAGLDVGHSITTKTTASSRSHALTGVAKSVQLLWSRCGFVLFALGGACCLYLAGIFIAQAGERIVFLGIGAVPLGVPVLLFWQAVRYWRLRRMPLVIDSNGRVSYGEQEWCPAASVRAVRILPDPAAEHGDCRVFIELAEGPLVPLPLPYFGAISHREPARLLGRELARALRVEVVESA